MATCAECGATSAFENAFDRVCPGCEQSGARRDQYSVWWIIVPALALLALVAAVLDDPSRAESVDDVMAFLRWWIAYVALFVVVHEFTHAIAAWGLGGAVHRIQLGHGRRERWGIDVGGTRLAFAGVSGGLCVATFPAPARTWRYVIYVGAPLVMHAGVTAAAWGTPLAYANAYLFVLSAIPRVISVGGQSCATDSLNIWLALRGAIGPVERQFAHAHCVDRREDWEACLRGASAPRHRQIRFAAASALGRWDDALAAADDIAAADGDDADDADDTLRGRLAGSRNRVYLRASVLVAADRLDQALAELEAAHAAEIDEPARAIWADGIALVLTLLRREPERARALSAWAFGRLPWIPYIAALHALLAAADPLAAVARAEQCDPDDVSVGMTAGVRAILLARRNDFAGARDILEARSRVLFPGMRRLIEAELTREGANAR